MFQRTLSVENVRLVNETMKELSERTKILEMQQYIQHGTTTVFEHMLSVAYMSLRIARFFGSRVDETSMVRGALLHDYFLYDWHNKKTRHYLHGFYHPGIALENSLKCVELNGTERDVIKNHMFPLTIFPPKTKEGFIVSCADKLVSSYETFKMNEAKNAKRRKEWTSIYCNIS